MAWPPTHSERVPLALLKPYPDHRPYFPLQLWYPVQPTYPLGTQSLFLSIRATVVFEIALRAPEDRCPPALPNPSLSSHTDSVRGFISEVL